MKKNLALYIHYPFCDSKCPYCDFNSYGGVSEGDRKSYINHLIKELKYWQGKIPDRNITTIYFGGGTPSLMEINDIESILNSIDWDIAKDCEITIEANPSSAEANKFKDFKNAGINRLSLGVQSLDDNELKKLGRCHTASEAISSLDLASNIFARFSFDMIYGRQNQTIGAWEKELQSSLRYAAKHISLYQLTIEPNTLFHKISVLIPPNIDEFYDTTNEIMDKAGFKGYEISNYCKKGEESRHNLAYWNYEDYLGIGAGAHSRIKLDHRKAIYNSPAPLEWMKKVNQKGYGAEEYRNLSQKEQETEFILMGLRLDEGINSQNSLDKLGKNLAEIIRLNKLNMLENKGFVETKRSGKDIENIRVIKKILLDRIIEELV